MRSLKKVNIGLALKNINTEMWVCSKTAYPHLPDGVRGHHCKTQHGCSLSPSQRQRVELTTKHDVIDVNLLTCANGDDRVVCEIAGMIIQQGLYIPIFIFKGWFDEEKKRDVADYVLERNSDIFDVIFASSDFTGNYFYKSGTTINFVN
jgi:hypothetical protein